VLHVARRTSIRRAFSAAILFDVFLGLAASVGAASTQAIVFYAFGALESAREQVLLARNRPLATHTRSPIVLVLALVLVLESLPSAESLRFRRKTVRSWLLAPS
jgi:hypothetical protein